MWNIQTKRKTTHLLYLQNCWDLHLICMTSFLPVLKVTCFASSFLEMTNYFLELLGCSRAPARTKQGDQNFWQDLHFLFATATRFGSWKFTDSFLNIRAKCPGFEARIFWRFTERHGSRFLCAFSLFAVCLFRFFWWQGIFGFWRLLVRFIISAGSTVWQNLCLKSSQTWAKCDQKAKNEKNKKNILV